MQYISPPLEKHTSNPPAILLLHNLGWQYLSPKQALAYRGGKTGNVMLDVVLREVLSQRTISSLGQERALSAKAVDNLVEELTSPKLNESLVGTNEHFYNHLLYGITVTEFIDSKKISCTVPIIDRENPENNQFHFTEEIWRIKFHRV